MKMSDTIGALAKSLAAAQSVIENATRGSVNPHFRSKYADLAEVLNTVRPVLAEHGISIVQAPSYAEGIVSVTMLLMHESGEYVESVASSPIQKDDPQGIGSATTYLRRYALAAMCGVAQEDDDGNAASKAPGRQPVAAPEVKAPKAATGWLLQAAAGMEITEELSPNEAFALQAYRGNVQGARADAAKAWLTAQLAGGKK